MLQSVLSPEIQNHLLINEPKAPDRKLEFDLPSALPHSSFINPPCPVLLYSSSFTPLGSGVVFLMNDGFIFTGQNDVRKEKPKKRTESDGNMTEASGWFAWFISLIQIKSTEPWAEPLVTLWSFISFFNWTGKICKTPRTRKKSAHGHSFIFNLLLCLWLKTETEPHPWVWVYGVLLEDICFLFPLLKPPLQMFRFSDILPEKHWVRRFCRADFWKKSSWKVQREQIGWRNGQKLSRVVWTAPGLDAVRWKQLEMILVPKVRLRVTDHKAQQRSEPWKQNMHKQRKQNHFKKRGMFWWLRQPWRTRFYLSDRSMEL